jgi:hypothetical protein
VLILFLLSGCYERVAQGNQAIYRFAWWMGPLIIVGGILGFPLGWIVRRWSRRVGFVLMFLSPILVLFAAPDMYSDRVLIDDDHFEARYGFWFSPNEHNVRFADLREIQYVPVRDRKGRKKYELHCITKASQVTVVHCGDLVKYTVPEILARAKARGVAIVSQGANY